MSSLVSTAMQALALIPKCEPTMQELVAGRLCGLQAELRDVHGVAWEQLRLVYAKHLQLPRGTAVTNAHRTELEQAIVACGDHRREHYPDTTVFQNFTVVNSSLDDVPG